MHTVGTTLSVSRTPDSTHVLLTRTVDSYDGIVVIKRDSKDFDARKTESECDVKYEFDAFMSDGSKENWKLEKERRTFMFKFAEDLENEEKTKIAKFYFRHIIEPEIFPKDHISFVRKCALLVYQIPKISQLHIILKSIPRLLVKPQFSRKEKNERKNIDKPVENYITVLTPALYDYQFMPEVPVYNKSSLSFLVRAKSDAYVALSAVYGDILHNTYEIIIGHQDNTKCSIRYNSKGPVVASRAASGMLDESEAKDFWISWKNNQIRVGADCNVDEGEILCWNIPKDKRHKVKCLAVSTSSSSTGEWQFVEILGDNITSGVNTKERKKRIQQALLKEAKRQIILSHLERAYPECISTLDLMKMTKISSQAVINSFLQELLSKSAVRQVANGVWLRSNFKQENTQDIQLVAKVPRLRDANKAIIAIISNLYCTKLAVEYMMENKTTYIKYKSGIARGESTVYTLGTIGEHTVVSMKLGGTEAEKHSKIAIGNAITRLMGTFDSIRHMLLIGVGGAVPNLYDFHQNVRQGDVVVSTPSITDGPYYMQCKKRSHLHANQMWKSSNPMLMNYVRQLWKLYQSSNRMKAPWHQIISQGENQLTNNQISFKRPDGKNDQIYAMVNDSVELVQQPQPPLGSTKLYPSNQTRVRYAVIAAGDKVAKNVISRTKYAKEHGISAYDSGMGSVLDSIAGSRCGSFLIIDGIADYVDGSKNREWQPYAALTAAAYMKTLVLTIKTKETI